METTKIFLKDIIAKSTVKHYLFQRNLLKEYLQVLVLNFIYSHPQYSQLVFYGDSCLSHCFNLPRLSEDLDFVDLKKKIKITLLAQDLENYFKKNTDLKPAATCQKFRIYLKFPLLQEMGLVKKNESNWLFLKIEVFKKFAYCKNYLIEMVPLFKFNQSILIKSFDLPTLMATKIRAILSRKWTKINQNGQALIKVKGRDYFDLWWYLQKKVEPNLNCLEGIKSKKELKEKLLKMIAKIDYQSIRLDLEPLIVDRKFTRNISKNIQAILKREIEKKI